MCLITPKSCYELLTAEKNITVYKILCYTIEEGFYTPYIKHCVIFDKIMQAEGELQLESDDVIVKISGGMFHSYATYFQALCLAESHKNMCVFKAIIPKGSQYIMGLSFELASNQLLIRKEDLIYKSECIYTYEDL